MRTATAERPAGRGGRSGKRRWRSGFPRWIGLAASVVAFAGFTAFLVLRLQEGFERRAAEWFESVEEVPDESGEVVSREIEFTRFDEQGRLVLRGRAEQALGPSDGQQRFLDVEVRLLQVHEEGDAVIAADELLIDTRTEALEFLGNALLSVEGLELSGPHLHFRRAPDRLWSRDPVQFQSEDFVGIAASMQFEIEEGNVSLSGVVAVPAGESGFRVVAERVRFDRETADTTLSGEVGIASEQLELISRESVVARRDRERGQMRSIEAGFATELRVMADTGGGDGAAPRDEGDDGPVLLRGDELEIDLQDGRIPRLVRVSDNPSFEGGGGTELRGEAASLSLDHEGKLQRLRLSGEVTARLPAADGGRLILVDSDELEVGFDAEGAVSGADFAGRVRARHGRASALAEGAHWNGSDTLILEGSPRVVDSSLLELEGGDLRLVVTEPPRVEASEAVTARFLPARLDWLPGRFDGVVLTGDSAVVETGSGQGAFNGSVRLLFGKNRLSADELRVDSERRTLEAAGEVITTLEFDLPDPPSAGAPESGAEIHDPDAVAAGPGEAGTAAEGEAGSYPPDAPLPFVFSVRAERFSYEAAAGRLAYRGAPRLEREEPSAELSTLVAGQIEADLAADGSLGAVRGIQGARFRRGTSFVRGSRIRYEPAADVLSAWGAPAVVEVEGRSSEGGLLELFLADNRSDIHPTRLGRAITRVRITSPGAGLPR